MTLIICYLILLDMQAPWWSYFAILGCWLISQALKEERMSSLVKEIGRMLP